MKRSYLAFIIVALSLSLAQIVIADTVITKDGSKLNGTITLIDKGVIHLETPYAGKLQLKQENVVSFESASPLNFRLKDGVSVSGTVTSKDNKTLKIRSNGRTEAATVEQIVASWTPDKIDPEIERNQRKWKNDFSVDLNGRTGNVERYNLGTHVNLRLKGPIDELHFGFDYEQGEQDGDKTADRTLGQVSYERFSRNRPDQWHWPSLNHKQWCLLPFDQQ